MTYESLVAGVLLIVLPTVVIGGVSILSLLIGDPTYTQNPLRQDLWRAGHAHAGVWLILASWRFATWTRPTSPISSSGSPVARSPSPRSLFPAAFFLAVLSPDATTPNAFIYLAFVGAVLLGAGVLVLGIGVLRHPAHN
jgi:hypothetical protein